MNDEDLMPFGKHKGTPIGEVPASYLIWVLEQDWAEEWKAVYDYCLKHERQLLQEKEGAE